MPKEILTKEEKKQLNLGRLTEIFWSEEEGPVHPTGEELPDLEFIGMRFIAKHYTAEVIKSDHYLLRDDPYTIGPPKFSSFTMYDGKRPKEAKYFLRSTMTSHERAPAGRSEGSLTENLALAFFSEAE